MKFDVLRESIRLCVDSKISCSLWAHRGVGKSSTVAQICREGNGETMLINGKLTNLPIGFVDFRCSQIEAAELRGLPDKKDGRTVYLPMADMPIADLTAEEIENDLLQIEDPEKQRVARIQIQPHYKNGILFLDELNRADDSVLQAAFQLLLDRRIGQYVLPSGWGIVIACNYMEGDYITNGFTDSAMLDRICHLNLIAGEETLGDWCNYMADQHGGNAQQVIEFCAANIDHLMGSVQGELGFTIQPSPRSWDRVVTVERVAKEKGYSDQAKHLVIEGLVGLECATIYAQYTCPVQPREILQKGVKPFIGLLERLRRNEVIGVAWGFISLIRDKLNEQRVVDIALDLADVLLNSPHMGDKDVVVAYIRALMGTKADNSPLLACITNRHLAEEFLKMSDGGVLLKSLFKREALHKKLASVGWGIAT